MKSILNQIVSAAKSALETPFSVTGPAALTVTWGLFAISAALLVVTLPICYAENQVAELARGGGVIGSLCAYHDGAAGRLLKVDHSAGTVICLAVFFGVLVRMIQYCRRFDRLEEKLSAIDNVSSAVKHSSNPDLAPLLDGIGRKQTRSSKADRLAGFHRHLLHMSKIRHYMDYLVAIGLIGTLLAFYFGFAERLSDGLSFASLDTTARELLTVVGTAAISSVSGLVLGMLAVPALADHLAWRRKRLVDLASTALAATAGNEG